MSALFDAGGQGQGRTAKLPLFRCRNLPAHLSGYREAIVALRRLDEDVLSVEAHPKNLIILIDQKELLLDGIHALHPHPRSMTSLSLLLSEEIKKPRTGIRPGHLGW
ncbi:hypothetical protein [Nonomuraea sp. KM90]|uniref:hypothetical protein n=1 Tax=Nonomuraea sp. KM90 TaxID=3457428 RepID=UPI003FCC81A3